MVGERAVSIVAGRYLFLACGRRLDVSRNGMLFARGAAKKSFLSYLKSNCRSISFASAIEEFITPRSGNCAHG